jgi:TRAP-type C4-dicarboxylate transport system permease small subunit
MRNKDIIETILEIGTFISFIVLITVVLLQVITRFLIPSVTLVWTEEASRFLFVYSVAFAAPLAMKKKEFVNVDILFNILPKTMKNIIEFIIYIITVILFVIVFIYGIQFAQLGINQMSPTMHIPMAIAYSSIAISSFFIVAYAILNLIVYVRDIKNGR